MTHEELFEKLIKRMKAYHPSKDFSMVEKAYRLAHEAHGDQLRVSGEPYIIHPLEVAYILADLELDLESITAGILHDVIEDTKYSYDDVVKLFGKEVADIVDGVTKYEKFLYKSKEDRKIETYRKMFLAMAKDIRVILIKVADRLHNVRTLNHMKIEKQKEVAEETLAIYAPLADRLGISKIKDELEDLSFSYLHPDEYKDLKEQIESKQIERKNFVDSICEEFKQALVSHDIKGDVQGRPKHLFSIHKKLVIQDKTLDQIYDLYAIRVIVETVEDCYRVMGIAHEKYTPIPGRIKDYIAMNKDNQYQSLHSTLISSAGTPFEIQIRTWKMHKVAEYGIAAHWKYKQGVDGKITSEEEDKKLEWLRHILEWHQDYSDNANFFEALKGDLDIYKDTVYCFTPKGAPISLVSGATPLDFAYAIHSAVGNQAVSARVNGKMMPFDSVLETGSIVEIITSQNSLGPSRDWLNLVKTSQARSKINQWFKKQNKDINIAKGRELLENEAKRKGFTLPELAADGRAKKILQRYSYNSWDNLYASIGQGAVKETQVINKLFEEYEKRPGKTVAETQKTTEIKPEEHVKHERKSQSKGVKIEVVNFGESSDYRIPKCCNPLPGDEIVGFISRGKGFTIHRTDCMNIINLSEIERQRLIETWWSLPEEEENYEGVYYAELKIIGYETASFIDVSNLLQSEKVPISAINAQSLKDNVVINVTIEIKSRRHLDSLISNIKKIKNVKSIERVST